MKHQNYTVCETLKQVATIETELIAMDAKSPSDVKTLCGHIYGLIK